MIIHIVDRSGGAIKAAELKRVMRAVNTQIKRDFVPYWGMPCTLVGANAPPSAKDLPDVQDACVLYLQKTVDVEDALGYHDKNAAGIPFGVVFTDLAEQLNEPWSVTFSHEVLELIGDPEANLLAMGPRPKPPAGDVFHWFEMCDAVQAETYKISSVEVSNFVLPFYFTVEKEGRNDFMGNGLQSFKVNPGGYQGYFDPKLGKHQQFSARGDRIAADRMAIKSALGRARRSQRYQMDSKKRRSFVTRAR
jgi:hypothetical protein